MTSISYAVTLNDNDLQTLEEVLSRYLKVCENEILNGAGAPFFAHRESIRDIRSKLFAAMVRGLRSPQRLVRPAKTSAGLARKDRTKSAPPRPRAANKHRRGKRNPNRRSKQIPK